MLEVERAAWTPGERDLWRRIEAHPFERADHALDFTRRLGRDRGWSRDFARGAVREYRRFCFLAVAFETPVTPSEEVDEVWHQHLTYSRDYWDLWCGQVLRRPLHHDPTAGGPAEQARYRAQYAWTLARYEAYFGPPDPDFWPGTHRRFRARPRYRIFDGERVLLVPRPNWGLRLRGWFGRAAGALALLLAAPRPVQALPLDPLDWTGGPFLTLYIFLAVAALVGAYALAEYIRDTAAAAGDLDLLELAYLAGGFERAADTVVLGLVEAGAASLSSGSGRVRIEDRGVALPPHLEPFRGLGSGEMKRSDLVAELTPRLEPVRRRLVRRSLAPSPEMLRRTALGTLALVGPVILLGVTKIFVGMARDKPVGFLVLLTLVTVVLGALLLFRQPIATTTGDAALARYRQRHARAARAPRDGELLFALALGGTGVLAGTVYEAYAHAAKSSNGGCGSSGGSGGGGGCGGCGD